MEEGRETMQSVPDQGRAELEAEVNIVRHSRFGEMAVVLDLMMG